MVNNGCIKPMLDLLDSTDPRLIRVILEGIDNILEFGMKNVTKKEDNIYLQKIEENGLDKIEKLQYHNDEKIYEYSKKILQKYFETDNYNVDESFSSNCDLNDTDVKKQIPNCKFNFL
mmetsp:Transcript_20546/g.68863  ORF Transcript_20546/g.68863 Transcript_20546/m.68863 type:complete len:118 (+) Transcript_20546:909-1262(+)